MAPINFQLQRWPKDCVCVLWRDREEGGGVWGLNRKAIKPFRSHKVLGQSKPLPARRPHVTVCVYLCVHVYVRM